MEKSNFNKINELRVDLIRHGDTKYLENVKKENYELSETPIDLTSLGVQQVTQIAQKIVNDINPEKETVVLWSSPAKRAQDSEFIIENLLKEKGIEVYKKSIINSMSPINKIIRESDNSNNNLDFKIKENAGRLFNWIRYLAQKANTNGKIIHIIGVTHHEFLNPIREDIFPSSVAEGPGFQKGENINIKFVFNKEKNNLSIVAEMRGLVEENIIFDNKERKFIIRTTG